MNKVSKGLAVVFVLMGLFMVVSVWIIYSINSRVVKENIRANAIIIKKNFIASSDGDSDFMLKYIFTDENKKTHITNRGVPEELYNKVNENDTIEIFYLKDNPDKNFPVGSGNMSIWFSIFVSILGLVFSGFGLAVLFTRKESV